MPQAKPHQYFGKDANERINAALQLLTGSELSISTFESIRKLIKGLHPELDKKLQVCSEALDKLQKIENADILTLSAEHLPEETEKQKKRKKALIFFIESIKDLKSEIKRVQGEFGSQSTTSSQLMSWGRIIKFAKGPVGLVTLAAIIVVVVMPKSHTQSATPASSPKQAVQIITYQGKQLPLTGLYVGHGPDCDSPHYHATGGKVTALDGSVVLDPEGCGFGKVADTQVTTIQK